MALDNERLLDETGWHILEALQENARLSFSELGQRVGLSSPAVAERVRRMEDAGIITGYRAEVNTAKIGYPITAIIRITNSPGERCTRLTASTQEIPEVLECYRVTGSDSLRIAYRQAIRAWTTDYFNCAVHCPEQENCNSSRDQHKQPKIRNDCLKTELKG